MEAAHLNALASKHAWVERNLQAELSRPLPNDAVIQMLKRQKLRIKDAIAHR